MYRVNPSVHYPIMSEITVIMAMSVIQDIVSCVGGMRFSSHPNTRVAGRFAYQIRPAHVSHTAHANRGGLTEKENHAYRFGACTAR